MLGTLMDLLRGQPVLALFVIIALGVSLGSLSIRGVSLGAAGVLVVAMFFGAERVVLPDIVASLGVVLFVYAVGLQAGPRFLETFRQRGRAFMGLTAAVLGAAFVASVLMSWLLGLSPALASGVFAGAMTSTPALAAGRDALASDPGAGALVVGFGAAYPFGVAGVILFVQVLPRLLGLNLTQEAERAKPPAAKQVRVVWFEVRNPLLAGKTMDAILSAHLTDVVISRVAQQGQVIPALGDTVLGLGDHVRAVGVEADLRRLELLVGPRVHDFDEAPSPVTAVTLAVTSATVVGKTLEELKLRERHGVNVTRVWRDDLEFIPKRDTTLEFGDTVRVAGRLEDCQRVTALVGHQEERLQETQFFPLALGLLVGVLLGLAPWPLPGGFRVALGLAGGPLLTGLVAGHCGRIGWVTFRIPVAAKYFIRELGLMFFLAAAGVSAGKDVHTLFGWQGAKLFLAGAVITIVPMIVGWLYARKLLRWDALTTLGALCGGMTSTPGLAVLGKATPSQAPSLAYVAVYPAALLGVTILTPLLCAVVAWLAR